MFSMKEGMWSESIREGVVQCDGRCGFENSQVGSSRLFNCIDFRFGGGGGNIKMTHNEI